METYGIPAYEVSNHAAFNNECKHNMVYWQYDDFLGIGPGAHSRLNGKAITALHNPEKWLEKASLEEDPIQSSTTLSLLEKIEEILLMGLRLTKGLSLKKFHQKTGLNLLDIVNKPKLDFLIENSFLKIDEHNIKSTLNGRLVLNQIIEQLTSKL